MKDWLVPVLRHFIAIGVAALAAKLLSTLGVAITEDQQGSLTDALTTIGAAVFAAAWVAVAKWLKPRFLKRWHPSTANDFNRTEVR
jgi:hypothetical protein